MARLKQTDTFFSVFGAADHRYHLNPPLTEAAVTAFEGKFEVTLPNDYRSFLLNMGNGGAGPYYGLFSLGDAYPENKWMRLGDIRKPFPLDRPWNVLLEDRYELPFGASIRDGCIMLSYHGCAYWSFLIVTGSERGKIWKDFTSADGGFRPTGKNFIEWYEGWLDEWLAPGAIEKWAKLRARNRKPARRK